MSEINNLLIKKILFDFIISLKNNISLITCISLKILFFIFEVLINLSTIQSAVSSQSLDLWVVWIQSFSQSEKMKCLTV